MILLSGAGLGFNKSRELGNRKKHLEMLMRMIILLKGEIRYGNTSLYDAFTGAAGKLEGKYREFFLNTAEEIKKKKGKPFGEIFRSCARESLDDQNFTREEKEKIQSRRHSCPALLCGHRSLLGIQYGDRAVLHENLQGIFC